MQTTSFEGDEFTRRLSLTVQEIEFIELTLEGLPMMQIAFHFLVDLESVHLHHRSIYIKLAIKNEAELIQFAIRHCI